MSPEELAAFICQSLTDAGIVVTLTGGGCVAVWSNGEYESKDLDFVEQGTVPRREIRAVLKDAGFNEDGRYFIHTETDFFIEFPAGPLAVGGEPVGAISERKTATGMLRLLSPTDCVKDRLAAFFHWNDHQALDQASLVARNQKVDLEEIRRWSKAEGEITKFETFRKHLTEKL
ncbi:MAG TPA: hypothetical protein VF275_01795 [Gammaproteobacteria bacterium]